MHCEEEYQGALQWRHRQMLRLKHRDIASRVLEWAREHSMPYFMLRDLPSPKELGASGRQQLANALRACTATFDSGPAEYEGRTLLIYAVKPSLCADWPKQEVQA